MIFRFDNSRQAVGCLVLMLALIALAGCGKSETPSDSLQFKFNYDVTITKLEPGKKARVWLPKAESNHDQEVELLSVTVPGEHSVSTETKYGNKFIYFEAEADAKGEIPVKIAYNIKRKELKPGQGEKFDPKVEKDFLSASSFVPLESRLMKTVVGEKQPEGTQIQKAENLYEAVYKHMAYGKPEGKGWGKGDAQYACDEKEGNCTDFHSLFISLSRQVKIPAKFEIGFMLPPEEVKGTVGGYHCWAKFVNEGEWVGVDISEADKDPKMKEYYFGSLTPNRVTFTTGRDLKLQPAPKAESVNYLVYPYVEVEGVQHTDFEKQFSYEYVK